MGGWVGGGALAVFVCLFIWYCTALVLWPKSEPNNEPGHPRLRLAICAGL